MTLDEITAQISAPDACAMRRAKSHWDAIAKPLGSLGLLEDAVVRIAGLTGDEQVRLGKRTVVVMCADNGVVAEGVTQTGQEVTAIVAENLANGAASVCKMARVAGCDVLPVDIGVAADLSAERILRHKISYGSGNIAAGPAMTKEQALDAVTYGAALVFRLKKEGCRIIATGEMGIGNTTTSSAVSSVLLGIDPGRITGRGAGLSQEQVRHKADVIRKAIAVNQPDPSDPLDVLHKLGGYDIAGLCGVFLGGAAAKVPVIIDGVISSAAALLAMRICRRAQSCMLAAHCSAEPAGRHLLDALELAPAISANLCLGEGSGAVALLPLLDMALAVYHDMCTFGETGVKAYQPL